MNAADFMRALGVRVWRHRVACVLGLGAAILTAYIYCFSAPFGAPIAPVLTIEEGTSVREAAELLEDNGGIRSVTAFTLLIRLINSRGGVVTGIYALHEGENAFSLAYRLAHGQTDVHPVRVTIPEGYSSREIALVLKEKLAPFDAERFQTLAESREGYLFPDTYLLAPGASPESVMNAMLKNFDERILELGPAVGASGRALRDVVIMASLVEKEARQDETRRIVAGILWRRLDLGMPLQVDAVFGYIMGTATYSPTFAELETDSPYNTYRHKGLPPGPIANPGLSAIEASLAPIKTPYLFYLTGSDGTMHYARTHAEHVANRKYLR
jgi:UPF0755 protein